MTEERIENPDDTLQIQRDSGDLSEPVETPTIDRPSPAPGLRGRKIGSYTLLAELGHGGQGYVYLAEDERLHRRVALKLLPYAMTFSEAARLRFEREAEVASRLDHPGICTVYETGEAEGIPFIAMQLVGGEALDRRIKASKAAAARGQTHSIIRLDQSEVIASNASNQRSSSSLHSRNATMDVVRFIEDTARAMHAAHETGLIHRDIKPGNIMAADDGRAVILDFGLARDESADLVTLTQSGDLMGTPAYMSPEQLTANRIKPDHRSDIYSLGATLYECLTLSRPFAAETREALYQAIQFGNAEDPRALNPAIGRDLAVVVETAMEKDRDRRYQSASEFAEDLGRVRRLEPIHARPAGSMLRLRRWTQRNPALATAVLGLFIAISSVAGVFIAKSHELAESNRRIASESDLKDTALTEKDEALTKESAALIKERSALAAYARLADVKKLQEAESEASRLWPSRPLMRDAIRSWLDEYRSLADNLEAHESALAELRTHAAVYTPVERDRDHGDTMISIAELEAELNDLEVEELTTRSERRRDLIEERLEAIPDELAAQKETLKERRSWRFEGADADTRSWKHDVQAKLVSDLQVFAGQAGTLADVTRRLEMAESIAAKTVKAHRERWDRSLSRIKSSKDYDGFVVSEQVGLIPLGADPQSGLEEFLHFESHSGSLPERIDGVVEVTGETGVIFVLLPGGRFFMGAQREDDSMPNHDPQARLEGGPVHEITLVPFFLSKYELTRGQWERISGKKDPSRWTEETSGGLLSPDDYARHPVEQVSWEDCDQATIRSGLCLPTEAQWEYGCRGGSSTVWFFGSDSSVMKPYANIAGRSYAEALGSSAGTIEDWDDRYALTAPVGSFAPNAFGLHDVHGNVGEWCRDWFGLYEAYPVDPMTGLREVTGSRYRLHRGGSFNLTSFHARSADRTRNVPTVRSGILGVRPSRVVSE